ncbi:hypothetical protein [Candidatus Electronema sp. JC]|uniref:hypothetical protein n=1 Tax=Candidatus Electronema sp. JC TaxID=3401570 RepID=UPI003B42E76E
MNTEELEKMKEVEFYASTVNAWYLTKLEKDRTLITLSAGAIGLLVTLTATAGTANLFVLMSSMMAIICFIICAISVVIIFNRNADYLEKVKNSTDTEDTVLSYLDKAAYCSFIVGIILSFVVGMSAGIDKYSQLNRRMDMAKSKELPGNSFNGASRLKPEPNKSKDSGSQGETSGKKNSGGSTGNTSSDNNQEKKN